VWLGFAGLPYAAAPPRRAWTRAESTPALIAAQAWSLMAFLAAALGMAGGFLLAA
jgi:hypothetical protein